MINDVWGLKADPDMARVAANAGVSVVLMHNQEKAQYRDLVADVRDSLANSVSIALRAGVPEDRIIIDPGIGFGKTPEHNLEILQRLREFKSLGYPLLVGPSRKSTIGLLLELPPDQRVEGTAAMVALSIAGGADLVRVHDVKEMSRVSRVSDAVIRGWRPEGWDR
jgi:dihydropteroate synthase